MSAIDGSSFELPDEADKASVFDYPGSRTSVACHAGYPQASDVVLVECATHAILGANVGPYRNGEWELGAELLPRVGSGMLCVADRGFNGYEHWCQARATGATRPWGRSAGSVPQLSAARKQPNRPLRCESLNTRCPATPRRSRATGCSPRCWTLR